MPQHTAKSLFDLNMQTCPPWQYLSQYTTKEMWRAHFIPEDKSLWTPEKFGEFLDARSELIAKAATQLLKSLK